ncbi:uncharacterized protein LOC107699718 isoform X2 [Sinocyclocheilus anshuiensis]|uniref:uncharacterized protein LOC107699718 isoform X2 n=1 Tax=Sinocyclocheilus anshuiensis TaxID=1608454 RepID=UPI0007B90828|nr:PREDICTED: uncharacterized protein LOC107699718 isoform X2 [Sinocyclocheilus anshuiensis]
MAFPVDNLTNVDHETLELTAEEYMSQLPYRNTEYFSLSDFKQIEVGLCNVSFVPLYGTDTEKKLLALFSPDDSNTIVGLYLLDRWWGVEDVLKTAEPSRTGLIKVSTLGERIVLYVLNRIVLRNEKSGEDVFFLCHCEREAAKILWKDGEAIGFYSFKPKGSLCRNFVTQCYQLPVMDTIFVRKCHRGQGHAIKILEDFVGSFRNEYIGLKFPLSEAISKVCEKYFSRYPADKELLWEVEKIGSPFQRTLIVNRLQKLNLKEKDQVVSKLNFDEGDATAPMEIEITKIQETTEYTVEIVEETIIDITKEVDDIPVTRRGRGSNLKRRAIRENSEERLSENIIRVEDIEAVVESSVEVAAVENLNTFSVKESETVLRSSVDTVTATVTNFAEFRGSQKEETREIENDIVTATSEGSPVTHLTTAEEIKNQRGSKEECEMVIKEYTIDIQGDTIGSIDQSQLQSVVYVEIVKMSTGTEEEKNENLGKNKEVEEDEPVCEAEMEEIKQMPDEPKEEKTVSEVAEQSETRAKSTEKVQTHWDMEITENKERAEDEVMAESEKDLIEENRDDNTGQEKSEPKDEDTVLQQSVEVKDQIEMEADSVREVLTTEEVLCDQPKQNEAETEVPEPNQTMTNKDTLIEKASKHTLGPDEAEQVFNKRTSGLTPSRKSKRLMHQPAEKDLATTKSVKTGQQRSKHHSKVMMQDEDIEQSTDEPVHDVSEVMEKIQEAQTENKAEAESEVEEYKEKDMLTVETVSTMDVEITQVEETVFPEVSELVERKETDQEEAPLQSSVEPPEIQESKTTPEEDEETVENSTVMLTLSEAKDVLVDLHECSPKEAGDNHGEIGIPGQEEMKLTMSSELQATEENMRKEEQDGTLDTKPMEEPACTTTTEGYVVAADANRTPEQSAAYKDQEYEPESETTEAVLLSQVEVPEKTDTEQDKEDKQNLYEADKFPKQGKQTQKKGSIDVPSRSTRLKEQPVDTGVTVRCLRSTLKPVKITPVRRSTRSKALIEQVESVEPQVYAKLRTDENPERDELIVEDVSPKENEMANTNADETASVECGSSEFLRAAEIDDKEKELQITKVTEEIPLIETEAKEDVLENRVEDIKNIENKEANLAGQLYSDIEMSSLAQEVHVQEEEVPISTERHLRRRTIRVQTPLTRKSRCVQKQKAEADVEHQERHRVVSKNKTDTILMTKEREDEMGQDVNKMENKEEHFAELEPVEEPNMSRNGYEKTSAITEETVDGCIPIITTEASLESLDEIVNTNTEETAVPESSGLPLGVEIDDQEKKIQIVDGPEEKVSLVEPGKEVENDDGTPAIKLQKATVVLVDLSKRSQNTEAEGEASEDLTHFQTEEKLELYEPDTSEQELSNLALEEEEQQEEVQTQEDTEKTPEEEKMEEENTVEEQNKLDKQDMTFEEQKPTEDLATMPAEGSLVESNKIENKQNEDEGVSGLAQENAVQENLEEEAPVSTQRSLRRRTKRVQSPPRRKSRRIQKQGADVSEDKTEIVLITEKEADEVDQGVEIVDKEKAPQTSIVDATEKVIPLVEAEPEDNVVEQGVEEINKLENKEANLAVTRDTGEETSEVGEEATLEQQQNEPLVKNDKETAETEKSMEFAPVVGKEQTYIVGGTTIQIEKEVSRVSLVEAEPDEEVEKDNGTPVIQLQKATVVLVDLNKLSQNTEGESDTPEVLTHSQTEEKLEQDKPHNSEYQLCNLTSEEEEQLEQLQKEEDTEKTPEKDKMEDDNTVEEQNEPNKQDMTFEEQKPTEDLEEQNDLKVTEIIEVYRAVDEDVEEAVNSGEHPEKTTTMADETNIIHEAEKDHNITLKEKPTDSDIEMSVLAQEAPETDQEVLEEEASVSTERSLRRRTIKIQSPPRRKSRRIQKQGADVSEDKTEIVLITEKEADEVDQGVEIVDKEKAPQTSIVDATEKVIPLVEAEPEDNVVEQGVEEINKLENKEANLVVTRDTGEETSEVGEEATLEQQQNEPLVKNDKETAETEKSMEFAPVVGKEQTYIVGGTTIQIEKEVSRVSLVEAEPDEEVKKNDGTPVIQLQKATVVLVDLNKLSQNTEGESDTPEVLTHSQTEEKLEQDKPHNSEYQLCNLTSEEEEQLEQLQKEEDTEKTPEKDKMEDDNTVEEQNEPNKQDMTFEEQKPTEDLEEQNDLKVTEIIEVYRAVDEDVEEAVNSGEHPEKTTTMADETNIIHEAEKDHNITLKEKPTDSDIEMSVLAQEAPETDQEVLEEEASVSTERSLRRRTIKIQSPPRRKSRRIQKQGADVSEDKTEIVLITEKEADEVDQGVEIVDKEKASQTSIVDATEKVIPLVEAEPEDNVVEQGVEEINKLENKEANLVVTRDTGEETSEVGEEATLEQQQNEPLVKNDKETTETETSMEFAPIVGKEQTYIVGGTTIQIEKEVSRVSLVEAEPDEEVEKDNGTPVIQLQKATVVLVDLNKLSQNTEGESDTPEVLTHSQTEEKLEQDKPHNSEYQLCNLTSEEEEQLEQLQKEEDTEKTPEKDKMEDDNTVEEQNEPNKQDMTFEEQKPTEDLEEQNDLKVTEIIEVYRAVDEDVEEAVNSGEHPEKTTTMADETNIIHEAEKDHNITLKEKPTDSDIEMSVLAQEAPETDQEVLEEEASVSTERSLRRRTIKIQSPPRRKSRRIQKQGADVSEDKTEIVLITEKEADEVDQGVEIVDKEKASQTSIVDATEKVIPLVEAEPEDNVVEQGVEEINKLENKEANLVVTRDTGEETSEVGEEATLEQQQNEPLVKNDKETTETETSMEFAPIVGKEQTYIVGGTTIQIEKEVSRVSLVEAEPDEEVEKDNGTPVIQLQKATVVLVDLNKLSQNTEGESDTPEVLTHSQTEEKLEQDKPHNSEYQLCNLTSEEEEQLEQLQKEEDTEKTPEKDKMEDDNTVEEQNEPNKQDMTFEEQKPTEDLEEQNDLKVTEIIEVYRAVDEDVEEAVNSGEHPEKTTTMADETNIIHEAEKDHNITLKEKPTDSDIEMSVLAQEAPETDQEVLEEEASVSTERSLRRRTIKIQSPPRRKSRRIQKQGADVSEDKTEIVLITEKEADEVDQGVEIVDKEKASQTSIVDATEKVIPLVEAEPEDNVVEQGVEEINKLENKEANLVVTRDTGEETSEVGEEATLEQQQNEPLVKNDKETTETETSMEFAPIVGKEQTYIVGGTTIQIEKEVSRVSLVEAEPDEEVEKDNGTPVIQLQKATVVLVDLNKLSQNTEGESDTPEVLTHSQTEEKLEQDKPHNSEYQLCNLTSEEEEQLEQLQKEEDTEKTPEKDKMEDDNTVEEQNEPNKQDMTFEEQKPTEDLEEQNDLKVTEIIEVYRAVDEDVEEAVNSGEHPEKTTTMADETNIIHEAEKDHNITLKEKPTDSDIEMSVLAQEAPETDQEVLEEEASVSTERSLRRRTIKIQSPPRRKSRRIQKQGADVSEDKTEIVLITEKEADEVDQGVEIVDKEKAPQTSIVDATEKVIPLVEAEPEDNVVEQGVEEINKLENKEANLAVTRDTGEETSEVGEEATLEQQQNEPLVKNDKETAETEKSMEFAPVVGKEQTYIVGGTTIQIEKEVSRVSLVEAEPDEEVEKDNGTPVIQLQKATVVLVDLNKLSQNTEGESDTPEVLTHSQTEEKLEQDKPHNSEYQLCNLTSEEEEQLEQLQKEEDTEKTPEKDKMEDDNTVEEQNEPNKQDMTFEEQKPTEDLEEQNDLKVTEIVEVYRAVDEDVEEAVNSGEHPETTTTMADETNIIQEAEKDHNITLKEKPTDSDIEISVLAQEAPETDQEV